MFASIFNARRGFVLRGVGVAEQSIEARSERQRVDVVGIGFECVFEFAARHGELLLSHELAREIDRLVARRWRRGFGGHVDAGDERIGDDGFAIARFGARGLRLIVLTLRLIGVGEILVQRGGLRRCLQRLLQMSDGVVVAALLEFRAAEQGEQFAVIGIVGGAVEQNLARAVEIALRDEHVGETVANGQIDLVERQRGFEVGARLGILLLLMGDDAADVPPARILRRELRGVVESDRCRIGKSFLEIKGAELRVGFREVGANQIDASRFEIGVRLGDALGGVGRQAARVGLRHGFDDCLGANAGGRDHREQDGERADGKRA